MGRKCKDLSGQIIGQWEVLHRDNLVQTKNHTYWLCKCMMCGVQKSIRSDVLQKDGARCECELYNPVGKRFERLLCVKKDETIPQSWICNCDCGKTISVKGYCLKQGQQSCGCLNREKAVKVLQEHLPTLTGCRFGKLTVIASVPERNRGSRVWKCICDCGNISYVTTYNLIHGITKSCGCIISGAEEYIGLLLQKMNITYQTQVTFEDLVGEYSKLRYDFGIYDSQNNLLFLIEYNGIQHYKIINHFGGEQAFIKRQRYDKMKINYAQNHQIPLLIIKFDENIDEKISIFMKEHPDFIW